MTGEVHVLQLARAINVSFYFLSKFEGKSHVKLYTKVKF